MLEIHSLIAAGVQASYIAHEEEGDGVGLTVKGWTWYAKDIERRRKCAAWKRPAEASRQRSGIAHLK